MHIWEVAKVYIAVTKKIFMYDQTQIIMKKHLALVQVNNLISSRHHLI